MAMRRFALLLGALAIFSILPSITFAAINPTGAGLVSCGVSSDPLVATECEACNLVQLVQSIIMFLIGLSIPIVLIMFTWAGVLYFTSGTGGSENITKAKKIFFTSLQGFGLAVGAWIIVNTILVTLLDPNKGYSEGSWFHIECSNVVRQRENSLGDILAGHLGVAPAIVPTPEGAPISSIGCLPGQTLKTPPYGNSYCENPDGTTAPLVATKTLSAGGGVGYCSTSNLSGYFGGNAAVMSCILQAESGCMPTTKPGDAGFSIGLAQINMTANVVVCNNVSYPCNDYFTGAYTCGKDAKGPCGKYVNGVYVGPVSVRPGYEKQAAECKTMLENPACNLETAQSLLNTPRGLSNWSTYGGCK